MEIGSEFSAVCRTAINDRKVYWLPYGEDYAFVFSGRTAMETVLQDFRGRAQKALLPDYCCASMIEPFLKAKIPVDFYPVHTADGLSVELNIPDDCTIVLLCNYFGFSADCPKQELDRFRKRGGTVIEDITHSLFSKAYMYGESNYFVASLRKWGALLSGGFCSKRCGKFTKTPEMHPNAHFLKTKAEAMQLKEEYLHTGEPEKKAQYLQLFSESNRWLAAHWSGLVMDEESRELLAGWDLEQIRTVRKSNASLLYRGLVQCSGVKPLFPVERMDCPLFVPVCIEAGRRDAVRQRLIDEEIYCPVHWPHPDAKCASPLYDTELSLICDQRYGEKDMRRLLTVLQNL